MLKIALCDDDADMLFRLRQDVAAFQDACGACLDMDVRAFKNGSALLDAVQAGEGFHIILLDIMMPGIDGMETARELRLHDRTAKIIFLTSSPDFALDAYNVKAYSYLLKTAPREKLFAILNDAVLETDNLLGGYTVVKTKTGLVKLFYHSVEFIEIMGKTVTYHLTGGATYEMYGTLTEIEDIFLSQRRFIKPHRSFIVNMDYIKKLNENEICTTGGNRVPVAKANYNEVKQRYIAFSFKRGSAYE